MKAVRQNYSKKENSEDFPINNNLVKMLYNHQLPSFVLFIVSTRFYNTRIHRAIKIKRSLL